ncbi:hypothetical protein [Psychrosphaera algicola]|uniref:Uncharacterized protein n=1 Tax=Psychrosphaera algicola TaxID=3023714 RepID=A0ABT5FAZ6_9GAMM|nr:hypothetical protein [Psychrosphaera sp. G1-22]MDC2887750.1 hypothetical protein [Psychrosphaera sp. G1-22]
MFTWLSVDTWFIGLLSLGYLLLLFFIAYWGQQGKNSRWTNHPWIYSLSLGVSCTSWAFYGIIGQAATSGQWLAYIYYGTIACFILAWPMLLKMLRISKQQNLTSIADFVACRYDKSLNIAGIVTVIALLGTIPYIALQLRAISQSFDLVTGSYRSGVNTTIIVAMVLSVFSVLFGARHVVANKQNNGLTLAIAFSSIVKLLAITTVGYYITFGVFDGFSDLLVQQQQLPQAEVKTTSFYMPIAQIALGFISIFITPQLFHVMVIENHNEQQLKTARWLYPLFLILINLFVLPIAIAGQITFHRWQCQCRYLYINFATIFSTRMVKYLCLYWWSCGCNEYGYRCLNCTINYGFNRINYPESITLQPQICRSKPALFYFIVKFSSICDCWHFNAVIAI